MRPPVLLPCDSPVSAPVCSYGGACLWPIRAIRMLLWRYANLSESGEGITSRITNLCNSLIISTHCKPTRITTIATHYIRCVWTLCSLPVVDSMRRVSPFLGPRPEHYHLAPIFGLWSWHQFLACHAIIRLLCPLPLACMQLVSPIGAISGLLCSFPASTLPLVRDACKSVL